MQADVAPPVMPEMLSLLREATGPAHERLDASFGALDLDQRSGLARFLAAHAIGLAPLFPTFRSYLQDELALECPDYPAMLAADLAALGINADALPVLALPVGIDTAAAARGVAYVVCGSRLGLAMIRQKGYWGEARGFRSAYMTDGRGHEAWKALVPVLRTRDYSAQDAEAARIAALAAFDTFGQAFASSATIDG